MSAIDTPAARRSRHAHNARVYTRATARSLVLLALITVWVQVGALVPDMYLRVLLHLGQAALAFAVLAFVVAAAEEATGALRR